MFLALTAGSLFQGSNAYLDMKKIGKNVVKSFAPKEWHISTYNFSGKPIAVWGIPAPGVPPQLIAGMAPTVNVPSRLAWSGHLEGVWAFDQRKAPDIEGIVKKAKNAKAATEALKKALAQKMKQSPNDVKYMSMAGKTMGTSGGLITAPDAYIAIGPNMEMHSFNELGQTVIGMPTISYLGAPKCPSERSKEVEKFVAKFHKKFNARTKTAYIKILKHMKDTFNKKKWHDTVAFIDRLIKGVSSGSFPPSIDAFKGKCTGGNPIPYFDPSKIKISK